MKQRPILFSTIMVQAILQGRKTQTRREVKPQPNITDGRDIAFTLNKWTYGQPGDVLWVRETYFPVFKHIHAPLFQGQSKYMYKADEAFIGEHKWKPSIHMPKAAARIWLQITNVRVERLHDISQEDAKAEGIERISIDNIGYRWKDYEPTDSWYLFAVASFWSLWRKINGVDSYNANPWVWVIEFQPIANPN